MDVCLTHDTMRPSGGSMMSRLDEDYHDLTERIQLEWKKFCWNHNGCIDDQWVAPFFSRATRANKVDFFVVYEHRMHSKLEYACEMLVQDLLLEEQNLFVEIVWKINGLLAGGKKISPYI